MRQRLQPVDQTQAAVFMSAVLLLFTSALFGGASQTNALSVMAVELSSLPLLFISLYLVLAGAAPRGSSAPLLLLAAIVALPFLHLAPLPYGAWTHLPGRGVEARVYDLIRQHEPSAPLTMAPGVAWRYALALFPPVAMFLGGLFVTERQRRFMAGCWLVLAVVSLSIGILQVMSGSDSKLYFYKISNVGMPIGLFSNRNHQAALLYCLIPVAAVFASRFGGRVDGRRAFPSLLAILYVFMAVAGVGATQSRAGILLVGFALLGGAALILRSGTFRRRWRGAAGVAIGGTVAAVAVAVIGLNSIIERFAGGAEPRFEEYPIVFHQALSYLPFGSGLGSFETAYFAIEPLSRVSSTYFNHAHNDFLELWLETGLVGASLFAAFAVWLGVRIYRIWFGRDPGDQNALAAASTLLVLLLLGHSSVDYPLRTEFLVVLFAFACSTIATYRQPEAGVALEPADDYRRTRVKVRRRLAQHEQPALPRSLQSEEGSGSSA